MWNYHVYRKLSCNKKYNSNRKTMIGYLNPSHCLPKIDIKILRLWKYSVFYLCQFSKKLKINSNPFRGMYVCKTENYRKKIKYLKHLQTSPINGFIKLQIQLLGSSNFLTTSISFIDFTSICWSLASGCLGCSSYAFILLLSTVKKIILI